MWIYKNFIPQNVAPYNALRIGVFKANGKRVCKIPISNLALPSSLGEKLYSFGALSDVHTFSDVAYTEDTTANDDFVQALTYLQDKVDFTCIGGDLTCFGTISDWINYKNLVAAYAGNMPVYAIAGNHEYWYAEKGETVNVANVISTYTGHPLRYTIEQGNDVYIFVGAASSNDIFTSSSHLQWLYEQLETNRNKRCFLFIHSFIKGEQYCGDATELYTNGDMYTDYTMQNKYRRTVLVSLLKHYKNVIFFHGHSHELLNTQEYTEKLTVPLPANYDNTLGSHSVHIPSLAIPIDITSGSRVRVYGKSEGYVVDVYENHIVLRGRDFVNEKFLPIATYCLDTTLQTIAPNTYTDSTGTITTQ